MIFSRMAADGFMASADSLIGSYASVRGSGCVILCSGPSASSMTDDDFFDATSSAGLSLFSINWGGESKDPEVGRPMPNFWTSYDPCDRFDPNLLLSPAVQKFIKSERRHEYIQGQEIKIGECPNVYFIETATKTFANFFGTGPIVNAKDSLIQAIDVAIRLGFKAIYLAGCDLAVTLSSEQMAYIKEDIPEFVTRDPDNSLWATVHEVVRARNRKKTAPGVEPEPADAEDVRQVMLDLGGLPNSDLYNFATPVDIIQKIRADHHYYLTSNWLRQSRRCLDGLGVKLNLLRRSPGTSVSRLDGILPTVYVNDLPDATVPAKIDYATYRGRLVRDESPYSLDQTAIK